MISAIINVGQNTTAAVDGVDRPWPLEVLDHSGRVRRITMRPGDMVWYESARVPHGREEPFGGLHYDNIFVHFYPEWYEEATLEEKMFPGTHRKGLVYFED